jgi:hypothetical protein
VYPPVFERAREQRVIIVMPASASGDDTVVTVAMSFYADAACDRPIQLEQGEPLVLEFDVDSSKRYERCRREDGGGNGTAAMYYEFFCDGDRIGGKILCEDDTCGKCQIDSTMHDATGKSVFPYGEMLLDRCLVMPDDNGTWLKFQGACPPRVRDGGGGAGGIIAMAVCIPLAVCCIGAAVFVWRKRRANQSRWYTSGPTTSSSSSYSAPMFAGV